jgi:PDZ domain-containing secreted protein
MNEEYREFIKEKSRQLQSMTLKLQNGFSIGMREDITKKGYHPVDVLTSVNNSANLSNALNAIHAGFQGYKNSNSNSELGVLYLNDVTEHFIKSIIEFRDTLLAEEGVALKKKEKKDPKELGGDNVLPMPTFESFSEFYDNKDKDK